MAGVCACTHAHSQTHALFLPCSVVLPATHTQTRAHTRPWNRNLLFFRTFPSDAAHARSRAQHGAGGDRLGPADKTERSTSKRRYSQIEKQPRLIKPPTKWPPGACRDAQPGASWAVITRAVGLAVA